MADIPTGAGCRQCKQRTTGASVGYGIGGARVEVEVGYERFKTRGIRDSGNKEDEGDTVYLLAKELAYNVLTDQTDKLAAALAKVPGKDIVAFAQALKASDKAIDDKICKGTDSSADTTVGECRNGSGSSGNKKGLSTVFPSIEHATSDKWPVGGGSNKTGQGHNVKNVTDDIMKLQKDEKTIVAGHLAKSIEGGEVVEIRSVFPYTNDVQY